MAACLSKPIKASQLFSTLVQVVQGHHPGPGAPAPEQPLQRVPRQALRVLLAEDNVVNQRVAMRLLQHLGYEPHLAVDGRQALQAVRQSTYDVVLMDIQMPEVDGVQAARQIVRQRGADGLPRIIAMTANAMPGDRETYIEAGMDGYLPKPIELAELAAVLEHAAALVRDHALVSGDGVLSPARLEHLRAMQDESQPSLVRELIDLFLTESAAQVRRIAEAHEAGEADTLRALAHWFLSTTQNIGALRLSNLCTELELLAKRAHLDAARPLLAEIARERDRAHAALQAVRMRY